MHVLLAAITGMRNDFNYRFGAVESILVDHGEAIHQALDVVSALQHTQTAIPESIEDFGDSRTEQGKRIEALAAPIKNQTTPSPPLGQADTNSELFESKRTETHPSNTPSGPITPETGTFAPTPAGGPADPYSFSSTTLRAVADTTVPREAMRTAVEAFVAAAGLPRD